MMLFLAQSQVSESTERFLRSMRYEFNEGTSSGSQIIIQVILLAAALLICWIVLRMLGILQEGRRDPVGRQPARLFRRVLRDAGLSTIDCWLLRLVAKSTPHVNPTVMLMSPALLASGARRWSHQVSVPAVRVAVMRRLSEACRRLHGVPLPRD
ncbi:MAG: hypothetical protein U1A27_10780 [Phycisphaerae bacterium]